MEYRELGKTGWKVSAVSLGTWAMGSSWGAVDERESMAALNRALDLGVNFFDTSDAYGSEPLLGKLRRQRHEPFYIATKMGMGVNPNPHGYNRRNLAMFVDGSLQRLGTDCIDLMQLHCPPIEVYNPEVFGILDDFVKDGKIRFYGVSVERIVEAEKAIEFPGVQSVMIIFNIFRQRPAEAFFIEAARRKVGIIARVPLASGLLTGKFNRNSTFSYDDHRTYNRQGQAFDRGETFSGVDYSTGLQAVEELRSLVPPGMNMSQVEDNLRAADLPPLSAATMTSIKSVYDQRIRQQVHALW